MSVSAGELFRKITADEIAQASTNADLADAETRVPGYDNTTLIERVDTRLATDYAEIHKHIRSILEEERTLNDDPSFMLGMMTGAMLLAHDLIAAAEAYSDNSSFGGTPS